jgi:hypothetical protein
VFLACGLSWGAGLIHLQAAGDHIAEYALFAVFFALLATAQFAWGVAICRSPARGLLGAGAVVSLLVVMLWAVSRTIGLPIGPEAWSPAPVGSLSCCSAPWPSRFRTRTEARSRARDGLTRTRSPL